ncbi:DUF4873 domain-containing protein [Rhodococcus sp. NPDC058521]|uniref:DUF4873 domain-containing protein n=1 Tax=Rhodococcus sp. NPDC058521 TaxID=3346536 RepID=UPI00364D4BC5
MSTHEETPDHHEGGYKGTATIEFDCFTTEVEIVLHGHPEPIDGVYRWYGRAAKSARLSEHLKGAKAAAKIHTPSGSAPATVGDPDVWDRYRIFGRSRPPYRLPDPNSPGEWSAPADLYSDTTIEFGDNTLP